MLPTGKKAHLSEKNRSGQDRLSALYRVSQVLGASLNLEEVLNQVMDSVISLTGAERGFLVLLDHNPENPGSWPVSFDFQHFPENLTVCAARNYSQETLDKKDIEVSRTVIQRVLESGEGVVTTDAQSDPRFSKRESILLYSLRSILCAPLKVRGQINGVIYIDHRAHTGLFTKDDLNLLNAFAIQAAIAIENARLYTHTDKALAERVAELETLTAIDRELNARLDYQHVLAITREWALKGTGAAQCWIALCNHDSRARRLEPTFQDIFSSPPCGDLPPEASQIASAALKKLTLQSMPQQDTLPAYLAAPILHSGEPIGVLVIAGMVSPKKEQTRPSAFPESARQFLVRLAGRAATAIENARLYQTVQETNQAKSKFVSLVTHELRIPMTSIKGYTDLIRQQAVGPVNDQQRHFLDIIRNNVDRMSTLVSELSDISRIESGQMKLELSFISLAGVIEEAIQNLRQKLEEKHQSLQTLIPADLPKVYADPIRVMQILTNLLSNAWKYTPYGGEIGVKVSLRDQAILVEIRDNGVGISPEDQVMLFTQFYRSEDPAVREQQGWGLGLNITKRLVELMNGEIGFWSKPQHGSLFWFTLPTGKHGA